MEPPPQLLPDDDDQEVHRLPQEQQGSFQDWGEAENFELVNDS